MRAIAPVIEGVGSTDQGSRTRRKSAARKLISRRPPCYPTGMLQISGITYRIGDRLLLDRATATIQSGQRAGLVGRNGVGKTTLFRLIAGDLETEAGHIGRPRHSNIGLVAQEAPGGDATPLETVLAAATERADLLKEAETAAEPHRIAEIHDRLTNLAAHAAPARAATILSGLGFDQTEQHRPLSSFSGGWRMRVALAAILFAAPDVLLLDEPTNHLDLEATIWLTRYLTDYAGTMIVISHDRTLLNAVANRILHLEGGRLTAYAGNYDRFQETRHLQRRFAARALEKQQAQRRHMQAFVDRFRYKATKARQAQSRLKALERLPALEPVVEDTPVLFEFPAPRQLAPPLIAAENAAVGYDGDPVLQRLSFRIDMDDRIALLGRNGNGKSTLARLLAGRLPAMHGTLQSHPKLTVGYFSQDQADELPYDHTPFELLSRHMTKALPQQVRNRLGGFDFSADLANTPVADLSGGEKARLLLALVTYAAPQLLILDEPTNHLDVDRRDALTQALNAYDGAILIISHDLQLVQYVADQLWLVEAGTCQPYDGDLDEYRRRVLGGPVNGTRRRPVGKQPAAATRTQKGSLRQQLRVAEQKLESLHAAKAKLTAALADPATYRAPAEKVAELNRLQARIQKQLKDAEGAWIAAQEAMEETAG